MKQTLREEIESGSKNASLKIDVIRYYMNGENTLAELGREMNLSVPTVTKLVNELIEDGYVVDHGKLETTNGRRPNRYGINPDSGYFMGVDIQNFFINMALINFHGDLVASEMKIPYMHNNTEESLDKMCQVINEFVEKLTIQKDKILNVGINISGRVNSKTGHSYSRYFFNEKPLSDILHERLGLFVTIDNDSRAMTWGEYICGAINGEKNILFINLSWGLGLGIIIDGKLYYGKSGYSGEFGHNSVFDNGIMCHCGKIGCLETEASGSYIYRRVIEKITEGHSSILQKKINKPEELFFREIIDATLKGDLLAIELIEEVGSNLGKQIAGLINIFNPEVVIIGGSIARTGDYLLLPIKTAVRKYALNLVSTDTIIKTSKLGDKAGVVGACMLARHKMLGLMD